MSDFYNLSALFVNGWIAAAGRCLAGWTEYPLRLGVRKGGQANHPPDGSPSLFARLSGGTLRVPVGLWGAPRPPFPLRKLLKKLEQNFYVFA